MNLAVPRNDGTENKDVKPTIIPLTPDSKGNSATDMENSPLHKTMERNKESLKSPSAFHEQRQKLERAKMGDLLKSKIQKRPDRQTLIQQHILEDTSIDSSLQEKQRQLKKARLVDGLNNQISHRPGPLELVKGNILQADEMLARAVREGSISFRNTSEESPPLMKILPDDGDSSSDCASPSPPYNFSEHSQGSFPSLEASEPSPIPMNNGSPCSARTSFSMSPPSSVSSPLSVMPSVVSPQSQSDQMQDLILNGLLLQSKETPVKNRKKAKPKTQPKARTIKFHEYKGPPNAQKNTQSSATNNSSTETSYDLLLQQQQLFLQWQLEWQQKYPQSVLPPSAQMTNGDQSAQTSQTINSSNQAMQHLESPTSPQKVITKLEDLKVSDLKAELKKRNLPVSGPKPILIERLKSYAESAQNKSTTSSSASLSIKLTTTTSSSPGPVSNGGILLDTLPSIPTTSSNVGMSSFDLNNVPNPDLLPDIYGALDSGNQQNVPSQQICTLPMDVDSSLCADVDVSDSSEAMLTNEAIVQLQQRCIEKLQMELQKSQMQLQQTIICHQQPSLEASSVVEDNKGAVASNIIKPASTSVPAPTSTSVTTTVAAPSVPSASAQAQAMDMETKLRQRQLIHQQLQQKIHQQSLQLQQQRRKENQHAKRNEVSSQPINANSTLTALLESEPISSPVEINLNSVPEIEETTDPAASFPAAGITSHVDDNDFTRAEELAYPGVVPIFMDSITTAQSSSSVVSDITKSTAATATNGIVAHRTSSLPSFSALVNNKPAPTRSNTDPLFLINRPPPNYNEATRQLNKMKQLLHANEFGSSRQAKKHKSSIKCQAVDDVLEILIKNGELPPSAAQEPQTPTTPITPKRELSSPPLYQSPVSSSSSSAVTIPTNVVTSPIVSSVTPISASCENEQQTVNLHMSSLQSVLDMTPPSSAGFGEPNNHTPSSLDFDFHLDVEDIEVMDLETLPQDDQQNIRLDRSLSTNLTKTTRTSRQLEEPSHLMSNVNRNSELMEYQNKNMDADIIEWLELLGDNTGTPLTSSASFHHQNYSIANQHDPMLSNINSGQDSLDLFSVDDMDFKTNEVSILSWDKADFAT